MADNTSAEDHCSNTADEYEVSEEGGWNESEYSWHSAASHHVSDNSLSADEDDVTYSVDAGDDEMNEVINAFGFAPRVGHALSSGPHPAEISGPSMNPDLQLLNIPVEVRRLIWQYSMTKIWGDVRVSFTMLAGDDKDYDQGYGELRKGMSVGLALGRNNPVALLYVSRKVYQEAVPCLYGENRFVSFNVRGFQHRFINDPEYGIGPTHAAMIKKVSFGIPEPVKQDPGEYLQGFVDFMSNSLAGLEHAELSVKYESYYVDPPSSNQRVCWSQERRALLHTVAWLAKSHPKLTQAVWCSTSGGCLETFWHGTKMVVRFAVYIVPAGKDLNGSGVNQVLDVDGKKVHTKDIVLDCAKIRETSWDDLFDLGPADFELVNSGSLEVTLM
ncbi:hypothetical protein LTR10_013483 [Elasticomyces elasticus]|uniref:Uncharacterized protein n=1 Tax=Exophiala sideris TaxID=1016849 RepID=A0ABR0JRP5_9EURO|nr:hypothetical protein LTR10_013483 [Elasticomyces elasticus]KAK5039619.1 hypothetical protein LTS07_000113 [Exophiala sideris]KAK5041171.1 hypothetical protein LTR13_002645 [Exophiala sideris]KAK5067996.1 hypothetical protein LTR69_000113 [Exophiala sideris]KAK5187298.1 hypothetical protein LTR44_000113 [Eurotiomycetes sp. CCFEE 6388]